MIRTYRLAVIAADLADIIGRPYVVEVLDSLSSGPHRPAELATAAYTTRRDIRRTLRTLASVGLVQGPGSFDVLRRMPVRLTTRGADLVRELGTLDAWTTLFDE